MPTQQTEQKIDLRTKGGTISAVTSHSDYPNISIKLGNQYVASLEYRPDGEFRLLVWSDVGSDETTHIIDIVNEGQK